MTRTRLLSTIAVLAAVSGLPACAAAPPPSRPVTVAATPAPSKMVRIPMKTREGGTTHYVPVGISGVCCFPFLLDSGASDVSISPDIFRAMVKDNLITKADLIDVVKYNTAAGTQVEGLRFKLPELNVGGLTVRNVVGSVTPGSNMLLLGQSFLQRFRAYAIDNRTGELVIFL